MSASSPLSVPLRRRPSQARGWQRVHQILDAAAALFAEQGYDNVTTNAIAERAATSIGSLYQFFPDKASILHALNARYLEQLGEITDAVLAPDRAGEPIVDLVDDVVDALAAFHAEHPGFHAVFYGGHGSPELTGAARRASDAIVHRLEALYGAHRPGLPAERRAILATTSMELMKAMLFLAATRAPSWRHHAIQEAKVVLRRYLAPDLDPPGPPTR